VLQIPNFGRGVSVRLRLAAGATALFLLLSGLTSVVIVQAVRHRIEDGVRSDATEALVSVSMQMEAGVPVDQLTMVRGGDTSVRVLGADGVPLVLVPMAGTAAVSTYDPDHGLGTGAGAQEVGPQTAGDALTAATTPAAGFATAATNDVLTLSHVTQVDGKSFTLLAEHPLDEVRRGVDALVDTLLIVTPLLSLGFGIIVWMFAGRALRPVDAMRLEVEEITHTTLHRRLTLPRARDEVHRLGHTMNGMLDRLEGAAERQRAFVSDASHDLRTPVSVVRTNLEVALRADDAELLRTASQRALDANIRLQAIIDELLDLAQLDEPQGAPAIATAVDLEDLVFDDVAPRGAAPHIDVRAVQATRISGDPAQLARVIRNLVDNAVAHAESTVRIIVAGDDGAACLVVDDDGPGVSFVDRAAIFERFTRLETARSGRRGGAGLGLSIVRRIVELHGASIEVTEAPTLGGARFVVRFPTLM
jgi:signal transduction histidine kinase